ncbi:MULTISPECIES: hypothetical protein [unclassified Microcoleus]|uniref:hypothetical protein n=1 Tax=unclassified Microcoleus TaxID=2642155 RepID=UPI002FCE8DD2
MSLQLQRRLFTMKEYHLMSETGILSESERVELIEGEIIQRAAIGTRHVTAVRRLNRLFHRLPEDRVIVLDYFYTNSFNYINTYQDIYYHALPGNEKFSICRVR